MSTPVPRTTAVALFIGGLLVGILLQRFFPVGSLLHRLGLRGLLPVPRQSASPTDASMSDPTWDVPEADRGQLKLFILAGQSNMSGRGSLNDPAVPRSDPRVHAFNKDFRWSPAIEPLGSRIYEVDTVATDGGTGVGPGLAFALALLESHPDWRIGLIPCARGASLIAEWQRDLSQNSLYGACLKRVMAAGAYGEVAGLLFAQGEGDADDPTKHRDRVLSAESWRMAFEAMAIAMREDLNAPDLPVVFTQLGPSPDPMPLNWNRVKQQQAAVAIPHCSMVVTDDLSTDDGVHFGTKSQAEIGRRLALAWIGLQTVDPHD